MRLYVVIAEVVFVVAVLYFIIMKIVEPIVFGRPILKTREIAKKEAEIERENLRRHVIAKTREVERLRRENAEQEKQHDAEPTIKAEAEEQKQEKAPHEFRSEQNES